jgi:hypothetical protein
MAKSPTARETFQVMTVMLNEGLTIDSPGFLQTARGVFTREGFEAEGPSDVMVQGRRFSCWRLEPPDPNVFGKQPAWAWVIIADGRCYSMELSSDENPTSNPDLMGMLNSFQFISPPQIPVADGDEGDLASSPVGIHGGITSISPWFIVGMIFYMALGPAVGIGILILFIKRQEKKRQLSTNARPPEL